MYIYIYIYIYTHTYTSPASPAAASEMPPHACMPSESSVTDAMSVTRCMQMPASSKVTKRFLRRTEQTSPGLRLSTFSAAGSQGNGSRARPIPYCNSICVVINSMNTTTINYLLVLVSTTISSMIRMIIPACYRRAFSPGFDCARAPTPQRNPLSAGHPLPRALLPKGSTDLYTYHLSITTHAHTL